MFKAAPLTLALAAPAADTIPWGARMMAGCFATPVDWAAPVQQATLTLGLAPKT